jgi:hypothetical protein
VARDCPLSGQELRACLREADAAAAHGRDCG